MPAISRFKLTPLNRAIRVFGVALLLSSQQAYSQTVAPPVNVDIQPMNPVTYDQISTGTGAVCASQYDNLINGLDATKVASDVTLNAFEAGAMATEEADWDAMAAGFTALAAGLDDISTGMGSQADGLAACPGEGDHGGDSNVELHWRRSGIWSGCRGCNCSRIGSYRWRYPIYGVRSHHRGSNCGIGRRFGRRHRGSYGFWLYDSSARFACL
jgi:hypothetical protein